MTVHKEKVSAAGTNIPPRCETLIALFVLLGVKYPMNLLLRNTAFLIFRVGRGWRYSFSCHRMSCVQFANATNMVLLHCKLSELF